MVRSQRFLGACAASTSVARQRGAVLVLAACCLAVLIAIAGLLIDSGRAYLVRERLSAASDAAGLAALRAAAAADDAHAADVAAGEAAAGAFHANFPDGWLGATPRMQPPQIIPEQDALALAIDANADMPVGLMAVAGFGSLPLSAHSFTRRRGIDVALALDLSAGQAASAQQLTDAAGLLLRQLGPALDRVALVRFAYGAQVDAPIRVDGRGFDRSALLAQLAAYRFDGCANVAEGLWQARNELMRLPDSGTAPRALVLFVGNVPGVLAARYAFADPAACASVGALASEPDASLAGLWNSAAQADLLPGACGDAGTPGRLAPDALPLWYNAHGEDRAIALIPDAADAARRAPTAENLRRAARRR